MKKNRSLEDRIVRDVYTFETKRTTLQVATRLVLLVLFGVTVLIFGGVLSDLIYENDLYSLIQDCMDAGEYTYLRMNNVVSVFIHEAPAWLVVLAATGILGVVVLVISLVKNRKVYYHKLKSLIAYWFSL
ncbi:MAG: hypothetical protein WAV30_00500 [Microgenomates group bacterium]